MSVPDPILEAAVAALHGDNCPEDPDDGELCGCSASEWERQASVALAAVRPLIEAKVRELYAERILDADANYGYMLNAHDAAEILREGDA